MYVCIYIYIYIDHAVAIVWAEKQFSKACTAAMRLADLLQTTWLNPGIVSAESSLCAAIHWGSSWVFLICRWKTRGNRGKGQKWISQITNTLKNWSARSCTDSPVVRDPTSDAGGPRFESQTGRVTGKATPKPLEGWAACNQLERYRED